MSQNQQLNFNNYRLNLLAQAVDSKVSFNEIDTPGWTSMVRTLKQSTILKERPINQILICESEVKCKDQNKNCNTYQKKSKQNKITRSDIHLYMQNQFVNPIQVQINGTKQSEQRKQQRTMKLSQRIQLRLKNHLFQTEHSASFQFTSSERQSIKSKKVQKNKQSSAFEKNQGKRFKEITVHQHLYQSSKRIMNKKAIQTVLDQKYQNQYITTFHPVINQKSCKIFEEKINGKRTADQTGTQNHPSTMQQRQITQEQHFSKVQIQQNKQQLQIKHLFQFLSQGQEKITQKTLNNIFQQLPLSCVRYLQRLVYQVFSGKSLSLAQFSLALNDKKVVCNKKSLLNTFQRSNIKNSIVLK